MKVEWFCEIAGRKIGPLLSQQLKTMAAEGQILPSDRVRQGSQGPWVSAGQVKGLFPPLPRAKPLASPTPKRGEVPVARRVPEPPAAPRHAVTPLPIEAETPEMFTSEPASGAPGAIPFDVAEEVTGESVVSKSSGFAHAKTATLSGAKRRQRQQQKMMVGLLLVAIVGLAIAGLILAIKGDSIREVESLGSGGLSRMAQKAAERARHQSPEELEELEGIESLAPAKPKKQKTLAQWLEKETAGTTGTNTKEPVVKEKWVDASMAPAMVEDAAVRVVSIVRTPLHSGDRVPASGSQLLITLAVDNSSDTQKLDFRGWTRGGIAQGVELTDNFGNHYRVKPVGRAPVPGNGPPRSIYPGQSGREVLAFELPIKKAGYLLLELPAKAFGKSGIARLKIPVTMIPVESNRKQPLPDPVKDGPKPGTPAYDFGIPEVDESLH